MMKLVLQVLVLVMALLEQGQGLGLHYSLEFLQVELIHKPNQLVDIHWHFLEQHMHQHMMKMLQMVHLDY